MLSYTDLGKQIYDVSNHREARRYLVFVVRCYLHSGRMQKLHDFFTADSILYKLVQEYPFAYEQATRSFFYKGSTFAERRDLIEAHLCFMKDKFQEPVCLGIYSKEKRTTSSGRARTAASRCVFLSNSIPASARKGSSRSCCAWAMSTFTR